MKSIKSKLERSMSSSSHEEYHLINTDNWRSELLTTMTIQQQTSRTIDLFEFMSSYPSGNKARDVLLAKIKIMMMNIEGYIPSTWHLFTLIPFRRCARLFSPDELQDIRFYNLLTYKTQSNLKQDKGPCGKHMIYGKDDLELINRSYYIIELSTQDLSKVMFIQMIQGLLVFRLQDTHHNNDDRLYPDMLILNALVKPNSLDKTIQDQMAAIGAKITSVSMKFQDDPRVVNRELITFVSGPLMGYVFLFSKIDVSNPTNTIESLVAALVDVSI